MNREQLVKKWGSCENNKCLCAQCHEPPSRNHSIQNKYFELFGGNNKLNFNLFL